MWSSVVVADPWPKKAKNLWPSSFLHAPRGNNRETDKGACRRTTSSSTAELGGERSV